MRERNHNFIERISLQRSRRWLATTVALSAVTVMWLTACGNPSLGSAEKRNISPTTSAAAPVAERAATRPAPTVDPLSTPCGLGIEPLFPSLPDIQNPQERQDSINRISRFTKTNTLANSRCLEEIDRWPASRKYYYKRFDDTEAEVEGPYERIMLFEKPDSKFEYQIIVTTKDSRYLHSTISIGTSEILDNLDHYQLAGKSDEEYVKYATEEAGLAFPPDTKWQRIVEAGTPRQALEGKSDSTKSMITIDDRGLITIYTAP